MIESAELSGNPLGTILLVQNSASGMEALVALLAAANFAVLQARNGPGALSLAAEHQGKIDLLVADLTMAGMSAFHLAKALRQSRPDLHVLFTSGNLSTSTFGWDLVQKPFLRRKALEMPN